MIKKRSFFVTVFCLLGSAAADVKAQNYIYGQDFSHRRVVIPDTDSSMPRITVQIDPDEQASLLAYRPPERSADPVRVNYMPEPGASGAAHWFWNAVSSDIAAASPSRILDAAALVAISQGEPEAQAPSVEILRSVVREHGSEILSNTVGTRVSPALVLAVIAVESAGRAEAESSAGAVGLMQLMPATAERFGVADRTDPSQSIAGGIAYLDLLMETFDGDPLLALAAYNAGEHTLLDRGQVPNYRETRAYVPKVLAAWNVARNLCRTPPLLASDGCVFAAGG